MACISSLIDRCVVNAPNIVTNASSCSLVTLHNPNHIVLSIQGTHSVELQIISLSTPLVQVEERPTSTTAYGSWSIMQIPENSTWPLKLLTVAVFRVQSAHILYTSTYMYLPPPPGIVITIMTFSYVVVAVRQLGYSSL